MKRERIALLRSSPAQRSLARTREFLAAGRAEPALCGLLKKLLTLATEQELIEAIRAFGLIDGTQEFSEALDAWHPFRP
jgi:hypothetical protein